MCHVVRRVSSVSRRVSPGRRADGAAQAVHAGRDGARPHGAQPVQGAADGAAGGGPLGGDDPRVPRPPGRLAAQRQETLLHVELVSRLAGRTDGRRSVWLPVWPSVRPSVCLSVCPSVRSSILPFARPSVRPTVLLSFRSPVRPSVRLSVR